MLFGSLCLFFIGGLLYVMTITLIFYRLIFYDVEPAEMTSPYWINMGAVAISTLAGAVLAQVGSKSAYLDPVMPFIIGLTLFFWANATWWIPLLVIFGIWRYVVRKYTMAYSVEYWSMVFPLGMYTACTFRLSQIVFPHELSTIPHVTFWFALAAWTGTFVGLVACVLKYLLDSGPDGKSAVASSAEAR
ncbi:MAG: tellurite resistance/C4-dicarboxylate transporter family protein [Deltaproteobacteria bacterium]